MPGSGLWPLIKPPLSVPHIPLQTLYLLLFLCSTFTCIFYWLYVLFYLHFSPIPLTYIFPASDPPSVHLSSVFVLVSLCNNCVPIRPPTTPMLPFFPIAETFASECACSFTTYVQVARSFKTFVHIYQSTRLHILEDRNLDLHSHMKFRYLLVTVTWADHE